MCLPRFRVAIRRVEFHHPPRVLAIGGDRAGNLLEIVWLELDSGTEMVIHAMPLRPVFYALLPTQGEQP